MALILRSFLVFLLLLAGYEALVRLVQDRYVLREENQWIGNYVRAQSYIYDDADPPVVLVGSSLSLRLGPGAPTAPRIWNLAFAALSPFDGIGLIRETGKLPKAVIVETNFLYKPADPDFRDRLFPFWGGDRLRTAVRSLREFARPVPLVLAYGQSAARKVGWTEDAPQPPKPPGKADPAAFGRVIANQQASMRLEVSPEQGRSAVKRLAEALAYFKANGAQVFFLEMPMHPLLCDSPAQASMRNLLRSEFPTVPRITVPSCHDVETTDGTHLTAADATRVRDQVAKFLAQQVAR